MITNYSESRTAHTAIQKPNISGSIYLYKNDPKIINKGVNVSNFQDAQGGYFFKKLVKFKKKLLFYIFKVIYPY
jgi:hypothetical protein